MKRFSLLFIVFSCLFLIGCEDTTIKAKTVEGILLSVEDHPHKINQTYGWKILKFQDGRKVMINFGPGDSLYIGHYQEIEINSQGFIVDVKCKSFEKLIANSSYKEYVPPLTQESLVQQLAVRVNNIEEIMHGAVSSASHPVKPPWIE